MTVPRSRGDQIAPAPDRDDDDALDLTDRPGERDARTRGLDEPEVAGPPQQDVRAVALRLLWIFGACLFAVLLLATLIAWFRPESLKDMIAFFGTVIATLGTLLGGVVAFYFTRH